ncbi:MAG: hypothetical protein Q6361_09065, partial [Candidatus Hermodarchaeota archaeon]|nr:hypothetical protein [Candidatus Hermodarchaeota archaeon]
MTMISVRVAEASAVDVGRFSVRLDSEIFDQLQISEGAVVEITGKNSICALVYRDSSVQSQKIIRMDGLTRLNAGVRIGDIVAIQTAEVAPARSIVLTPLKGE